MGKLYGLLNKRAEASYTVEGSFVFGIAICLIAAGICVGFDVCRTNLGNITAAVAAMPSEAGSDAADSFRLLELAKDIKEAVSGGD